MPATSRAIPAMMNVPASANSGWASPSARPVSGSTAGSPSGVGGASGDTGGVGDEMGEINGVGGGLGDTVGMGVGDGLIGVSVGMGEIAVGGYGVGSPHPEMKSKAKMAIHTPLMNLLNCLMSISYGLGTNMPAIANPIATATLPTKRSLFTESALAVVSSRVRILVS